MGDDLTHLFRGELITLPPSYHDASAQCTDLLSPAHLPGLVLLCLLQ